MRNKLFVTVGLITALMAAGCSGAAGAGGQTEAPQTEQTAEAAQETAEEVQESTEEVQETTEEVQETSPTQTPEAETVKYESSDGWSVSYNNAEIEVNEDNAVYFSYKGEAEGTNQVSVLYYPGEMPDEVLYNAMAIDNELPEHTRSEGYFAGRTDVWSIRTNMDSVNFPNATDDFIAVERNGGTLLVRITTTKQANEDAAIKVSDALAAVVDSFELTNQEPQKYSQYVPGKYTMNAADGIEGEEAAEYYVQFNEDHTGVIHMQDDVSVIWYSREGKVLDAANGEQIYEYVMEGDSLYLTDLSDEGAQTLEFSRESGDGAADEGASAVDYSDPSNWSYFGVGEDKDVDLFLVGPTVDTLDEENMSLENDVMKKYFAGALEMERGLYEESARMYAPYYRQMALGGYSLEDTAEKNRRLQFGYQDVSDAFKYYLENENNGRPIILAGFSQGSDMVYRLLEEYFGDEEMQKKLVAVYAIGWACTEDMVKEYPQIKPAQAADDLGVVISFDCEAPEVTETVVNPAGQKAYCINPLNWKTDSTPADKSQNIGSRLMKSNGKIINEPTELCGCYIDEERGVLKVTDVSAEDYPAVLDIFPEGAYHLYDYQFFFMNLKENVQNRVELYMEQVQAADQAA